MTKPSEKCRASGLASLQEMSEMTGRPVSTLIHWNKNQTVLFDLLLIGCKQKKLEQLQASTQ